MMVSVLIKFDARVFIVEERIRGDVWGGAINVLFRDWATTYLPVWRSGACPLESMSNTTYSDL